MKEAFPVLAALALLAYLLGQALQTALAPLFIALSGHLH